MSDAMPALGLSGPQRRAVEIMRQCAGTDHGWAVLTSAAGSFVDSGQAWIHWRTGLALVRRDLAEHDEDYGLIRLWEHSDAREPMTLFDQPDDWPEVCWIEVTVGDEDAARDALAEHCCEENGTTPFRPVGPASREWHRNTNRIVPDGEVWEKCAPTDEGATEFWRVPVY